MQLADKDEMEAQRRKVAAVRDAMIQSQVCVWWWGGGGQVACA